MKNLVIPLTCFLILLNGCQSDAQPANPTSISTPVSVLNKPSIEIIAHRGARSMAPENTIQAAQKGFEVGANMWELDVALSKDGIVVIIHDNTLNRTSNATKIFPDRKTWKIEDFTLAELKILDFGSWFVEADPFTTISSGVVSVDEAKSFVGIKIPTLQEALQFTRENNWRVNIEIKDLSGKPGDATIVEKVVELVKEMGMQQQVIISSFNQSYLVRSKKADAGIKTAVIVNTFDNDPVTLCEKLGVSAYNPNVTTMNYQQIKPLRQKNVDVYVWTVNDETTMRNLIEAGVSGIFTDYPQLLHRILK